MRQRRDHALDDLAPYIEHVVTALALCTIVVACVYGLTECNRLGDRDEARREMYLHQERMESLHRHACGGEEDFGAW